MNAVINGRLVLTDSVLDGRVLLTEGEKIIGISDSLPENLEQVFDAEGLYVSAGFIDMHTHGGGGHDFMDSTVEAVVGACKLHLSHGTTAIVPTTLTCPNNELLHFFEVYRQAKTEMTDGPRLLGLHLEGPYFSPAQAGAQDPAYLKTPFQLPYSSILEAGGSDIIRVSAAPELEGAMELGRELKSRGIVASIGHSDADYLQVKEAVENGYSHVTHLYSGMSSLHRVGPYRVLGVVESAYLMDELSVEIIADGKHLPPELLRLIVKTKDNDKICLVTDSMRGAGLSDGQHALLGSLTNGQDSIIRDGVAMMPDFKAFAGSVCTSDRCVRTMYKLAELPLSSAVAMITRNPAKILGVDDRMGSIAEGMNADLCVFDDDINIKLVFVAGKCVYKS